MMSTSCHVVVIDMILMMVLFTVDDRDIDTRVALRHETDDRVNVYDDQIP